MPQEGERVVETRYDKSTGELTFRRSDGSVIGSVAAGEPEEPDEPTVEDTISITNWTKMHTDTPFTPFGEDAAMGDEQSTHWYISDGPNDAFVTSLVPGTQWRVNISWNDEYLVLETAGSGPEHITAGEYWSIPMTVVEESSGWDSVTGSGPVTIDKFALPT